MKTEINVNTHDGVLTIREGQALPLKEPNKIVLEGDINSVGEFLEKRTKETDGFSSQIIEPIQAVVITDKEAGTIELQLDPENFYGTIVKGTLEESKELGIFQINQERELSREDLIKLFRFNRIHFSDPLKADALIKSLQKFSGSAYVDLVKEDDTRGNLKIGVDKRVKTGIPESFELNIPIYKGQPKERIEVEICLDITGTRVSFWFESVQLVELLEQRKDEIFAKQLESCKGFPIINK